MTRQIGRRTFLRGLGGACVAAPFLGSVIERAAKAQAVPPPRPAKRLIVLFTHYGCITTRFFPKKSHGVLTAADLEPTTLRHLAPYVDKLLIPRGIRAMNEWTATLRRGQGNDPHLQVVGSFFTCQPVTPNSDEPLVPLHPRLEPKPPGPSLDHVMAQQLSADGKPLLVRVGDYLESARSAISYMGDRTMYPGIGNPKQLFAVLTGLFQDGAPPSPDTYQALRGKSILDLVKADLETLERFDMSRADRQKLEAWKELLDASGKVMSAAHCSAELAAQLGVTSEDVEAASASAPSGDVLARKVTATLDGADVYSNLAVLAAVCNLNPVIFLKYPPTYVFRELGITLDTHSLSHRLNDASMQGTCVPRALDMLLEIDDFYARKFAYLVGQLNGIDEGDGKVLDNTAAVWFQEMSDGCAHNLNNLPIVQAGSAGGYFKTGWTVNVDDGSADLTTGNSEFFCADGGPTEVRAMDQATGTPPDVANAPINKYFCNLMNALGVKAGSDGFPQAGGAEEVTRFGMYDRTEDFIGGGTNPPMIRSPGEFIQLKADA